MAKPQPSQRIGAWRSCPGPPWSMTGELVVRVASRPSCRCFVDDEQGRDDQAHRQEQAKEDPDQLHGKCTSGDADAALAGHGVEQIRAAVFFVDRRVSELVDGGRRSPPRRDGSTGKWPPSQTRSARSTSTGADAVHCIQSPAQVDRGYQHALRSVASLSPEDVQHTVALDHRRVTHVVAEQLSAPGWKSCEAIARAIQKTRHREGIEVNPGVAEHSEVGTAQHLRVPLEGQAVTRTGRSSQLSLDVLTVDIHHDLTLVFPDVDVGRGDMDIPVRSGRGGDEVRLVEAKRARFGTSSRVR